MHFLILVILIYLVIHFIFYKILRALGFRRSLAFRGPFHSWWRISRRAR